MTINIAASIKQKLLNHARHHQQDFQQTLTRYALERLLYRLSISEERNNFVLKGAMLFQLWLNLPHRPTRDLDFLGFGDAETGKVATQFQRITTTRVDIDDGIWYAPTSVKVDEIRKQAGYPGVRVRLQATLASAQIPLQCDIGFGDAITPAPLIETYPTMLDLPAPILRTYPPVTAIAEKLEAIIKLDMLNSRVKDFFDIWILLAQGDIDKSQLTEAIARTFARRETSLPMDMPAGLSPTFAQTRSAQWNQFIQRNRLQAPAFSEVVETICDHCWPLLQQARNTFTHGEDIGKKNL